MRNKMLFRVGQLRASKHVTIVSWEPNYFLIDGKSKIWAFFCRYVVTIPLEEKCATFSANLHVDEK